MKRPGLGWLIILATVVVEIIAAFIFLRNPGPTFREADRTDTITYPEGRELPTDKDTDATLGVILPYLATPH